MLIKVICDVALVPYLEGPKGILAKWHSCSLCVVSNLKITKTSLVIGQERQNWLLELFNQNALPPFNKNYDEVYDRLQKTDNVESLKYISLVEMNVAIYNPGGGLTQSKHGPYLDQLFDCIIDTTHPVKPLSLYTEKSLTGYKQLHAKYSFVVSDPDWVLDYELGTYKKNDKYVQYGYNHTFVLDEYFISYLIEHKGALQCFGTDISPKKDYELYSNYLDQVLIKQFKEQIAFLTYCKKGDGDVVIMEFTGDLESPGSICNDRGGTIESRGPDLICDAEESSHVLVGNDLRSITCGDYRDQKELIELAKNATEGAFNNHEL